MRGVSTLACVLLTAAAASADTPLAISPSPVPAGKPAVIAGFSCSKNRPEFQPGQRGGCSEKASRAEFNTWSPFDSVAD
jgi:hypothetical protein